MLQNQSLSATDTDTLTNKSEAVLNNLGPYKVHFYINIFPKVTIFNKNVVYIHLGSYASGEKH